jgi:hypothetical protein
MKRRQLTTERLLLTDPSTGRICTTCTQRLRTLILTQHHYDFIVYGDKYEHKKRH